MSCAATYVSGMRKPTMKRRMRRSPSTAPIPEALVRIVANCLPPSDEIAPVATAAEDTAWRTVEDIHDSPRIRERSGAIGFER